MQHMSDEQLASIGREWLRVVDFVRRDDIAAEHDHVRFRDSDLSIKGAALLGFAGLMLAADLVFLSAGKDSFIAPDRSCGMAGVGGLFVLMAGSFCAVLSIMISRTGVYQSAWGSFGLMKLYHDRRRRWLAASAWLTAVGTLICITSMLRQVLAGRCA